MRGIKNYIVRNIKYQNGYNNFIQNSLIEYESLHSFIEIKHQIFLYQFNTANALAYLHRNDIAHCAVNTKKILIDFSMKLDSEIFPRSLLQISALGNNAQDKEY